MVNINIQPDLELAIDMATDLGNLSSTQNRCVLAKY